MPHDNDYDLNDPPMETGGVIGAGKVIDGAMSEYERQHTERIGAFIIAVQLECEVAREENEPFNSLHEALAVIGEEYVELARQVFKKPHARDRAAVIKELIQISAMCFATLDEIVNADAAEIANFRVPSDPPADYFPPDRYPLM